MKKFPTTQNKMLDLVKLYNFDIRFVFIQLQIKML